MAAYDNFDHAAEATIVVMVANESPPTDPTLTDSPEPQYDPIPFWSCNSAPTGAPPTAGLFLLLLALSALRLRQPRR